MYTFILIINKRERGKRGERKEEKMFQNLLAVSFVGLIPRGGLTGGIVFIL